MNLIAHVNDTKQDLKILNPIRENNKCLLCEAPGYSIAYPLCKEHSGGMSPFIPREYQEEGILFLHGSKRAMNTDAPGLGKTNQAALAAEKPVLIICPNYLVTQWAEWLCGEDEKSRERNGGRVVPNVDWTDTVVAVQGDEADRRRSIRFHADWTIINIQAVVKYEDELKRQHYETIIIDESHHVKNHTSARARAVRRIVSNVERVYELSATPVKREIDDLFMQIHILHPDLFPSYNKFVQTYCDYETDRFGVHVKGAKKKMIGELEEIMDVIRLGRSYEMAGRQLPPVIESYVKIVLPPAIRKIYDEAVTYWRIEELEEHYINYMQVYHQLRQLITGAFKYGAVKELLADEVRKAVTFTWYKPTAYEIQREFGEKDMVCITGDIKDVDERIALAKGPKHVVGTISAMSEGIDMSDARTVIYAEEDWTPGSNYQAVSRVVRDRNDDGANVEPVRVIYVHCVKTIDEIIHARSKKRAGTIRDVIREALYL